MYVEKTQNVSKSGFSTIWQNLQRFAILSERSEASSSIPVTQGVFWGEFLNRTWASIKATEYISSYLLAPVQGWAQSHSSSFAENISTALRGPHDRSGVAISRQE